MPQDRINAARILGERVRVARSDASLTQEDLSEMTGLSVANIGRIERGETNPTLVSIVRIASALEVDAGRFVEKLTVADLPKGERIVTRTELIRALRAQRSN